MTSSFSDKGRAALLDQQGEISRSEILNFTKEPILYYNQREHTSH